MWLRLTKVVLNEKSEILINMDRIESMEKDSISGYTRLYIAGSSEGHYLVERGYYLVENSCDEIFKMMNDNGMVARGKFNVRA